MDLQTVALEHEAAIRLAFFAGVFAVMGVWEVAAPKRAFPLPRSERWPGNVALVVFDAFALRIVFPGAAVGMAVFYWFPSSGLGTRSGSSSFPELIPTLELGSA